MKREEIFNTIPEWAQFSPGGKKKKKKKRRRGGRGEASYSAKLTWKFPCKPCSTTHLHFLPTNPKILNASALTLSTEVKPSTYLFIYLSSFIGLHVNLSLVNAKQRKENGKKRKKRGRESWKAWSSSRSWKRRLQSSCLINALGSLDRQFILYPQYDYTYRWENNLKRPLKIYT